MPAESTDLGRVGGVVSLKWRSIVDYARRKPMFFTVVLCNDKFWAYLSKLLEGEAKKGEGEGNVIIKREGRET